MREKLKEGRDKAHFQGVPTSWGNGEEVNIYVVPISATSVVKALKCI